MPSYKDKNGNWYVKYQNKTKRGFKTKKEADKYEAQLKVGSLELNSNVSFEVVEKDFLECKKNSVHYGTFEKYKAAIDNVIDVYFDNKKKISQITKLDCRRFHDKLRELDYSTKHKNFLLTVFKAIFKHASLYFDIKENPSLCLEKFKTTYDEMLKSKDKELNIWTVEEFERFVSEIDNPSYKTFFIIMYYTGLRLGEALALKWKDFKDGQLDIYKSITFKSNVGTYEEKEPKNANSIRKVCVGNNIIEILDKYHEREMSVYGYKDSWFIFGRENPLATSTIDRIRDRACKKANVKRIRIHDLRHSHASYLISNGVNIVAVSRRLGHSDINMTLKTYTHLFKNDEKEITGIIDVSSQNLLKYD